MGENCFIGHFTILYGHGGLKIGNDVSITANTIIVPSKKNISKLDVPINLQGNTSKGITIEDDVWIGAHVTILDAVTLHKGAIVGAGSVVTRDVDAYSIVAGNPAKHLKYRKDLRDTF